MCYLLAEDVDEKTSRVLRNSTTLDRTLNPRLSLTASSLSAISRRKMFADNRADEKMSSLVTPAMEKLNYETTSSTLLPAEGKSLETEEIAVSSDVMNNLDVYNLKQLKRDAKDHVTPSNHAIPEAKTGHESQSNKLKSETKHDESLYNDSSFLDNSAFPVVNTSPLDSYSRDDLNNHSTVQNDIGDTDEPNISLKVKSKQIKSRYERSESLEDDTPSEYNVRQVIQNSNKQNAHDTIAVVPRNQKRAGFSAPKISLGQGDVSSSANSDVKDTTIEYLDRKDIMSDDISIIAEDSFATNASTMDSADKKLRLEETNNSFNYDLDSLNSSTFQTG